ncbi:CBS domain-containing protein [Streptomyces sp. SP18CS02]|uniref:CBS domain-containing protein n=1 Tax=Streptomyces sp. SP18CS02 TaxID=3002531 RepID=UPI002E79D525|nr:CBS domain-containing protein [Streptomyces sp. SP18CS02]MEE1753546.1 CBS domain-containing protein [Streptomyces sp. SP18CS02]
MTLVHTQSVPVDAAPTARTVLDAMDSAGPQVWDDMTVEVALSVMAGARAGHLLVRDGDGRCTGLVTLAGLRTVRDSPAYTDRIRLRDVAAGSGPGGPFLPPHTPMTEAQHLLRHRRLGALPVVDEHGRALGVLALSR